MIVIESDLVFMLICFLWATSPVWILGTMAWLIIRGWEKREREWVERKYHYLKYKKNRKNNK